MSDKKLAVASSTDPSLIAYYNADVVTANDYYPFGMIMPGRKYSQPNSKYRYGFNGQEKSDEIFEGSTTAEYWEYDSRTGRRWNVDPKPKAQESSYMTFADNPVKLSDIGGDCANNSGKGNPMGDTEAFFQRDDNNYMLNYYPVLNQGSFMTSLNNSVSNVLSLFQNITYGAFCETGKGINNYFAGGYKEPSTDIMRSFDQYQSNFSKYVTNTPANQQLKDLGNGLTDLKNYELPAAFLLFHYAAEGGIVSSAVEVPGVSLADKARVLTAGGEIGIMGGDANLTVNSKTGFFNITMQSGGESAVVSGEIVIKGNQIAFSDLEVINSKGGLGTIEKQGSIGAESFLNLKNELTDLTKAGGYEKATADFSRMRPSGSKLPDTDTRNITLFDNTAKK